MVLSMRAATLTELSTTIGVEGLHDLIEVIRVDQHNQAVLAAEREREAGD